MKRKENLTSRQKHLLLDLGKPRSMKPLRKECHFSQTSRMSDMPRSQDQVIYMKYAEHSDIRSPVRLLPPWHCIVRFSVVDLIEEDNFTKWDISREIDQQIQHTNAGDVEAVQ